MDLAQSRDMHEHVGGSGGTMQMKVRCMCLMKQKGKLACTEQIQNRPCPYPGYICELKQSWGYEKSDGALVIQRG